jgi:FemAB-related protein (PEP-CTERM system-associated)
MPYLNYGGALGEEEARRALAERALDEARRSGARRLELRDRHAAASARGLAPAREKVTVLLDLPPDPEALFQRFRSKLRSQLRRPLKEGMETRFGPDQREAFYDVFRRNMRDLGTPVLPARLFQLMAAAFPGRIDFAVVRHAGKPVAAGCGFHHRDEFEMTWASSLRELNRLAPNMLLDWSTMERCIELGRTTFNFGRCTPGAGTHRFKLQWGSEDRPLAWRQWPEGAHAPDGDTGAFAWATRVWSRLPLPVTDRLGPLLARRIPSF